MKTIFIILLSFHALIHLRGYAKKMKPSGTLWLLTTCLLLTLVVMLIIKSDSWWMIGIPGLILSQVLIVIQWKEAKFGTIANLILLMAILFGFGSWRFNRQIEREAGIVKENQKFIDGQKKVKLQKLPYIIQKWIRRTGTMELDNITSVCIVQRGKMRISSEGEWYPFTARQLTTIREPAFIWHAGMMANAGIKATARDYFMDGNGSMLVKILSLIPVVDAAGPEIDQGAMLRFLAELSWYPDAALADYLTWESNDTLSAQATMSYKDNIVTADFFFNNSGDLIRIQAQRYFFRQEGSTLETWVCTLDETGFRVIDSIRVPTKAGITWKLREGDYHWLDLEIIDLVFNKTDCNLK